MSEVAFLVGQRLVEVRVGMGPIRLVFDPGVSAEPALYANIEQPFVLVDSDGTWDSAVDWTGAVGHLASAVGQEVVAAEIAVSGALDIGFEEVSSFRCNPHPDYEAWQVVGGSPQTLVVCVPGGGEPTVFDSSHVPTVEEAEEAVRRLNELMGWNAELREVAEDGSIIVKPEPPESPADRQGD